MNTSTTAQCGSEIVGHKELMDLHAENFQLRSELTRLRNENSGLANKALSLQSELAAARKALEYWTAGVQKYLDGDAGPEFKTKHDQCPHNRFSWEGCDTCTDEYFVQLKMNAPGYALSSKEPEGTMDRVTVERLAAAFRVSPDVAQQAQDDLGYLYRERASKELEAK